jgi:hypothetical protein
MLNLEIAPVRIHKTQNSGAQNLKIIVSSMINYKLILVFWEVTGERT